MSLFLTQKSAQGKVDGSRHRAQMHGCEPHTLLFFLENGLQLVWDTRWAAAKENGHYFLQQWMPLSYISDSEFSFLQRPHLASKSLSQPLLPSLKNVSYSLWGSHPRKIDGSERPGGRGQGCRGKLVLATTRGGGGLLPTWRMLIRGPEGSFGELQVRSQHSPQNTGMCEFIWRHREERF